MAFKIPVPMPLKIRAVPFSRMETQRRVSPRTANHPRVILCRALKASPNDCPSGRDSDGIDATVLVTNVAAEERTKQGTGQIVHGDLARSISLKRPGIKATTHDASLKCRSVDNHRFGSVIPVAKTHDVDIASGGIDAPHHSLIIAKEEDGKRSDAIDGDQEGSLLKAVDKVEF